MVLVLVEWSMAAFRGAGMLPAAILAPDCRAVYDWLSCHKRIVPELRQALRRITATR